MRCLDPRAKALNGPSGLPILDNMDIFKASERLMGMDEAKWARHASPWSVYSRFTVLPLLVVAIWSRVWLGWGALLPVFLVAAWAWFNPGLFRPPATTDHWAAKGTFGERVFLNRKAVPIPAHHLRWGVGLSVAAGAGLLPLAWGLVVYDPGWTLAGLILTIGAKLWFVDRMVWLYEDMKDADPVYRGWLR